MKISQQWIGSEICPYFKNTGIKKQEKSTRNTGMLRLLPFEIDMHSRQNN